MKHPTSTPVRAISPAGCRPAMSVRDRLTIRTPAAARPSWRHDCGVRRRACAALALASALLAGCSQTPAPSAARMSVLEQAQLRQRALDFIHRAARSEIDVVCCNAIEALVQLDPDGGARHFRAALGSPVPMVRFAGCVALGEIRDTGEVDRLRRLISDADPHVQLAAAYGTYRCGGRDAGWQLAGALRTHADENVRADAAYLIGKLGEPEAAEHLRLAATNDKSSKVRVLAIAAMARLGDREGIERLIQVAQGDATSRVVALQSIAELATERMCDALLFALSKDAKDEYLENRLIAARGLGKLNDKSGFDLAFWALTHRHADPKDDEKDTRIRVLAAMALGDIADMRALAELEKAAAGQDDARVQLAASYAICRIVPAPMGTGGGRSAAADRPR
ncbi:MAG: hypothetical protein CHACPFDD_01576 [Phycisphaerae bacterium]|nr:hypothetical protein [Phycisphaerae bacterium]